MLGGEELEEQVIKLDQVFEAAKKRWLMIVSITLIFTIISAVLSFFVIKPKYEASTKLFIGKEDAENQAYSQNDILMYQKLMKTYSETIKTKDLIEKSLSGLNLNLDLETIIDNLKIATVTDTQILKIKYIDENPQIAKLIVKNITDEFIETSKELVPNGNIKIIEKVEVPQKPVSPNKKLNIAIAFLLGFILSFVLVVLLEFLDNTFKTKEELERKLDIPVIGAIPEIK